MTTILRGNIIHTPSFGALETVPGGCLVLEDGVLTGIFERLPERYAACPVEDFGEGLILPAFADLHLHAPQYPMLGMGMDLPLLEWLNTYTFKTEERFADTDYARRVKPPPGGGAHRQWHHPGIYVLLPPHRRHPHPHGGAGAGGRDGLCGQGEHGPQQRRGPGDHRGVSPGDPPLAGGLPLCPCEAHPHPPLYPSCTDELLAALGRLAAERDLPVQSTCRKIPGRWPGCGRSIRTAGGTGDL